MPKGTRKAHAKRDRCPLSERNDVKLCADPLGALAQACQSISLLPPRTIEAFAVVANLQPQSIAFQSQFNHRLGAAGMPHQVVDTLFEDEKYLATQFCIQRNQSL